MKTKYFLAVLSFAAFIYLGVFALRTSEDTPSNPEYSQANLDEFPQAALEDKNATILDLSGNSLTTLPSQIGDLTKLEELDLSNNLLDGALPSEIGKMTRLTTLYANDNNFTGIPAEIGKLSNLVFVDFSNNNITGLPNELANLTNLEILDLSDNPISQQDLEYLRSRMPETNIVVN